MSDGQSRASNQRGTKPWSVFSVAAIALLAVGLAVGLLLRPQPSPDGLAAGTDPSTAEAVPRTFSDQRAVTITLQTGPDVALLLHTTGVVTSAPANLTAQSGKVLLRVDGTPVFALATAVPTWRSLAVGASGSDVKAFNDELRRLGYHAPTSKKFTQATAAAWAALQQKAGVAKPSKAMSLAQVIWLPAKTVSVTSWAVTLGSLTPPDQVIGRVPGQVASGLVEMGDGSPLPQDVRTLTVDNASIALPPDCVVTDDEFLTTAQAKAMLVSLDGGATYQLQAQGTITLTTPLSVLAIPPAALFAINGSMGCVQIADAGVGVRIVGSSLGVSLIQTLDSSTPDQVAIGAGITKTGC